MTTAYRLRAPGQKGIRWNAWGSFLGQLLLRSMDRAEELYASMRLRGFQGDFPYAEGRPLSGRDLAYFLLVTLGLLAFRIWNVSRLLGGLLL